MTNLTSRILRAVRASESPSEEIAIAIEALGKRPEPLDVLASSVVDAIMPKRRGRPPKYNTRQMTAAE